MTEDSVFHIYVDESSQTGHHYMAIGAIFCRRDAAAEISTAITETVLRHKQRADKELHWSELKGHTLGLYQDASSQLIGFTQKNRKMRYRALVVDAHQVDKSLNKDRRREVPLAKFIFTLVFGFARDFGPKIRYHVWVDKRSDTVADKTTDKQTLYALNNKAKTVFGWPEGPFADVAFVDSKKSRLIQATDILTGAVAYETNGKHLASDASKHRVALMRHIIEASRLQTLALPTPRWPFHFQIAHFDFEKSFIIRQKSSFSS
ncbi:MAG: DUF3800 domain-containing protein [Hyphomicrobium sp.]